MKKINLTLIVPAIFLILSGCGKGPKPVAAFIIDKDQILARDTVAFTDMSTDALSWLWEFGDDSTSTIQHPKHIYKNRGDYTVTLTVTGESKSDDHSQLITVLPSLTGKWSSTFSQAGNFNGTLTMSQHLDGRITGTMQFGFGNAVTLGINSRISGVAVVIEATVNGRAYSFKGNVNDDYDYISGSMFVAGNFSSNWYALKGRN